MADPDDEDEKDVVPDFVDDPVVADPKATKAAEFAFQRRAMQRIIGEFADAGSNAVPVGLGKTAEFLGSGGP